MAAAARPVHARAAHPPPGVSRIQQCEDVLGARHDLLSQSAYDDSLGPRFEYPNGRRGGQVVVLQRRLELGGRRRWLRQEVVYLLVVYLQVAHADEVLARSVDIVVGGRYVGGDGVGALDAVEDILHREADDARLGGRAGHRVRFARVGLPRVTFGGDKKRRGGVFAGRGWRTENDEARTIMGEKKNQSVGRKRECDWRE